MSDSDDVNMEKEDKLDEYQKRVAPEIFFSAIITITIFLLTFYDYLPWEIIVHEGRTHIPSKNRFIFTLQLAFIDILPLLICIFVLLNRINSRGEKTIENLKYILKNTFEQFIIKLMLSFILCTILRSRELLLLPIFTFLFLFGRFTFAFEYPNHTSFGMTMNFTSILLFSILITYRLLFKGIIFQYIYWK